MNRHSCGKYTFGWSGSGCRSRGVNRLRVCGSVIKRAEFSGDPVHGMLISDGDVGSWDLYEYDRLGFEQARTDGIDEGKEVCPYCHFGTPV